MVFYEIGYSISTTNAFTVEKLGLKEVLPAYLDPNIQSKDLLTGVNFASGGAGYDSLTSEKVVQINLKFSSESL